MRWTDAFAASVAIPDIFPSGSRAISELLLTGARAILYPIIDTDVCKARGLDPVSLSGAYLRGGARTLQLRDKSGAGPAIVVLAGLIAALAHRHDARLVLNDRVDLALAAGADGVHVGQDDLPVDAVRRIAGASLAIGVSTHDETQVDAALDSDASYVAVGPIYRTMTKDTGYAARGLALVSYAARRGKPVVAIGGITLARAPEVLAAGASALAVITDLLDGDEPEARARAYLATQAGQPFKV